MAPVANRSPSAPPRPVTSAATASFGTLAPAREGDAEEDLDQRGSLYVDIAEDEDAPSAFLEYHFESPFGTGRLDIQALRAVRHALADDPEGFMRAIDETLGALEAKVSA